MLVRAVPSAALRDQNTRILLFSRTFLHINESIEFEVQDGYGHTFPIPHESLHC